MHVAQNLLCSYVFIVESFLGMLQLLFSKWPFNEEKEVYFRHVCVCEWGEFKGKRIPACFKECRCHELICLSASKAMN
jgi:hypothetical protein